MKKPEVPAWNDNHRISEKLEHLMEYSKALAAFSRLYNKQCDFLLIGVNLGVVLAVVGIFTPTIGFTLAAVCISTVAGIILFTLTARRHRYLTEANFVLDKIGEILDQSIIKQEKLKKQSH